MQFNIKGWNLIRTPKTWAAFKAAIRQELALGTERVFTGRDPMDYPVLACAALPAATDTILAAFLYPETAVQFLKALGYQVENQLNAEESKKQFYNSPLGEPFVPPGQAAFNRDMAAQHLALIDILQDLVGLETGAYERKLIAMRALIDQFVAGDAEKRKTILESVEKAALPTLRSFTENRP